MLKKIIIPLLLILFITSMAAFGAPVYVNVGPTTEFDGDIKILSEIVAEGVTSDGWETTVFFTDPTADNTITIPDYDVTVGSAILLTVTDNENTNENNAILFTSGGVEAGILNIESDGGDFYYNPSDGSLHATLLYGDGTNLTNVGAAAATALTITGKAAEDISKGEVVYISGATGPFAEFSLADNTDAAKHTFCGVAAETKTTGQVILIRVRGELAGFDTSAFADGDVLYLSTAGALTNVKPTSGAIEIIGYVSYDHAAGSIVIMHHSAHGIHVPSTDDIIIRMGDSIAGNKVYFKDYANTEVAFIDSDGKADFTSLTLDTALLIAEGGTNSAAALINDRVMVSSGGAIIHSATITVTELGLLNGIVSVSTGVADNDKFVTQGYVDDIVGGANTALSNLAAVQINTTLLSDAADTDSLGTAAAEWLNLYIGDAGKIYCGLAQDISIHRSAAGMMTLTAANGVVTSAALTVTGALGIGANNLTLTGYVGRDADNFLGFDVDNTLKIEINNVLHSIVSISDGAANNDKLCTQGYADDAAAGGGANVALSNLAGVAINLSLVSDAADTDSLGSATAEWLNLYLGTYGTVYFGTGQTENIAETAVNELTITATTVAISGTLAMGANGITSTGTIGRDTDNYLGWGVDNSLAIKINGIAHAIVSITDGVANNDKLATQGYVDDQVAGANVNLSNLGAVAINTTLISDAADTDSLGDATHEWLNLYLGDAGKIYIGLGQDLTIHRSAANTMTLTASSGVITSAGLTVTGNLIPAAAASHALGSATAEWTDLFLDDSGYVYFGLAQDVHIQRTGANTMTVTASGGITFTGDLILGANSIGRDADNDIDFETDNIIQFRTSGADCVSIGTAGEIDLEQFYILLDDSLGTDHDYSGLVDSDTVGENVVFGDLLYFDWTAVEWKKAKANVIGTTPAQRIALESKADGQACLMLVQGWIRDDSAFDFGASRIFLNDDVAGTCDDTAPAESGDQIQVVGVGTSADTMYFNPSIDVGEI